MSTRQPHQNLPRRGLQHRLNALRAGLRAALRAFRTHPVKQTSR